MKKLLTIALLAATVTTANAQASPENPRILQMDLSAKEMAHYMAPGWNLGNTMEACDNWAVYTDRAGLDKEKSWQSDMTTQSFINLLKEKGFKSVRIPCGWVAGHLTNMQNMTLDAAWVARVKEIINFCFNANLNVVINDHWDGGWLEYDGFTDQVDVAEKKEQLRKLWTNIANEFKDYDERLIFAGLNEPGVGGASAQVKGKKLDESSKAFADRLLEYEQVFIDAVRATGGKNGNRVLVVQSPKTEIDLACSANFDFSKLHDSAKNRLMMEVHFYEPYIFCQMMEDENWGKVALYWKGHNPSNDVERTCNTVWCNNQNVDAEQYVLDLLDKMKTTYVDKEIPVVIGEFGANRKNASSYGGKQGKHNESITAWYRLVASAAMRKGLIPFVWDTNHQDLPHMTMFDRAAPKVSDTYIYKGVMDGVKEGIAGFNQIYPQPSDKNDNLKQ